MFIFGNYKSPHRYGEGLTCLEKSWIVMKVEVKNSSNSPLGKLSLKIYGQDSL